MQRMKKYLSANLIIIAAIIYGLFAIAMIVVNSQAATKGKTKQISSNEKSLIGTWVLVGTQNDGTPSGIGSRFQFFTEKHWVVTQADRHTGEVLFHLGGHYTINSDEVIKTIDYANASTSDLIKQSHTFKINIKGDTLMQIGIGNPWNETWVRAK